MHLLPLPGFSHAVLKSVSIGPRRAVTLTLSALLWVGQKGHRGSPITVRLGGIVSFDEATTVFTKQRLPADIAGLDYAAEHISKSDAHFIEIVFERVEAQIVIQGHSVLVSG